MKQHQLSFKSFLKSLKKEFNAEYFVTISRSPSVYRGFPFIIEVGLAYGGDLPKDEQAKLIRFANRVPLLFQPKACSIYEGVSNTNWKPYGLNQSKGNMPVGPLVVVVHLASKVGGIKYYLDNPAKVFSDMLLIDQNVWKSAIKAQVPYFFYASSAHVYPIALQLSPDAPLIKEEQVYPANPELSYGWAKLMGEKQIEYSIQEGCNTRASIARLIGAYGPNQDIDLNTGSAIPAFIRRAIEYPRLQPYKVLGTGEETRSYCYIDDIIEGIIQSVEKLGKEKFVGPFNLGREDRIKIGNLAQKIIEISDKDIKIEWDKSHPTTIWGQALDCSLARELLDGWQPRVSLEEGLKNCYEHIASRLS